MKILVIRLSSIGDIVMMTPAVRCLKLQQNTDIHFLTKQAFTGLVSSNPYIDKVIPYEKGKAFIKQLKQEKYDYVVDLHNNLRSTRIRMKLKCPHSKINKLSIHKQVLIHTGISNLPNLHVAHRAIDALAHFDVTDDEKGMDFFLNPGTENKAENLGKPFVSLALGTTHFTKNIPYEKLETLIKNSPLHVLLLGGPKEKEIGEKLEQSYPHSCTNMAGKTSLQESALLIRESKYFIGGDTGMLHIACALKVPTISIWGATIPEYGVYPYYGEKEVPHFVNEVSLKCRPCSKHGSAKCPKKHFNCMNIQNMDIIASQQKELA